MCFFIDDASMPVVNEWGDQVTNELTRQLMEQSGFYFLDKDKRGDFKTIEGMQYIGAMGHPGGGKNDIAPRLKSKFLCFNMVPPLTSSVKSIYGSILNARFTTKNKASAEIISLSQKLIPATIQLWERVKGKLLPTPQRFHYLFNMRELSRVFQGVMDTPIESLPNIGRMVNLWRQGGR